jgi:class 3 adenylate cyclase/tetratricopeptide (TPR) repeat protein
VPVCRVCEQENPDGGRFCSACGAALTAEPRREERKVVSVLFADLVGFTSRAERLDPEDVRAVLGPYWERLRSELERHGGTVEKFIGDAVMALFGAPVTHEDDTERAVRAALAIRDWAREEDDLQVRIAVTTGEALVLLGARPAEGEGMAAGDVVNTAARLQSAAPVNGVLVGESTYRATRDAIEYVEREPVAAKGKKDPVLVWEAVQAKSRLGMDLEQRALLPLVGRVRDLETIVGALERAQSEREPQLVTLVGVPGIGKSRLIAELFARLQSQPDLVRWRQGRALPYGEGVSFWALTEMIKAQAGIQENDSAETAEAKLRESVDAVVEPGERGWVVEHLLPLVGLAQETLRGAGSFPAWRRYFEGLAEQHSLILVFEDLHWADEGLLDFVDHLAEWATGVPLLVLGTARPELLDRRPGWGGGKLNASTLALTPLTDEDAVRIIHNVLEQSVLPVDTQRELLQRAGGNPLYAEQFARLYVERGTAHELPETIQGIVAARLDGLSDDEKRLVQDAAVLGKVFWTGAAAELSGLDLGTVEQGLHVLERKGLIRRERRSAVGGQDEYAFRHVLVRDVAYGQIPRTARGDRHAQAADWIEGLGRADDHAELLAHHLGSALELARAAGTEDPALAARARIALRRAGDRALSLHAYAGAFRFYGSALELWPDDGERPKIVAAHARARFRVEGDDDGLAAAIDALEAVGELEEAAELAALAAQAAWRAGRRPRAEELLSHGERLLAGRPASRALAAVLAEKARLLAVGDEIERAEEAASQALRLAEELGLDELRANILGTQGVVRFTVGELEAASALLELALEAAPPGSPEEGRAATNRSLVSYAEGDLDGGAAWLDRAAEACTRIGDRPGLIWLETGVIEVRYYLQGRWDEALVRIESLLATMQALGGHYLAPMVLLKRASVLAARDDSERAARDLETALSRVEDTSDLQFQMPILIDSVFVCLLLGDRERASNIAERAAVTARAGPRRGAPPFSADSAVALTRCGFGPHFLERFEESAPTPRIVAARLVFSGKSVEAAEHYARMSPEEEAVVRLLAGEQLAASGRAAEADVQSRRALAFYRAVGATRIVRDAEKRLAAAS